MIDDPGAPMLEGLLHQGMMFSEGTQRKEESAFDPKAGVGLHADMLDSRRPTMVGIAPADPILLRTRSPGKA